MKERRKEENGRTSLHNESLFTRYIAQTSNIPFTRSIISNFIQYHKVSEACLILHFRISLSTSIVNYSRRSNETSRIFLHIYVLFKVSISITITHQHRSLYPIKTVRRFLLQTKGLKTHLSHSEERRKNNLQNRQFAKRDQQSISNRDQ